MLLWSFTQWKLRSFWNKSSCCCSDNPAFSLVCKLPVLQKITRVTYSTKAIILKDAKLQWMMYVLSFIQNISLFPMGSNPPANSSYPTCAYHIWKMLWAIYHRFEGIFRLKLNGNNARIRKTPCSIDFIYFLKSICKKKQMFILKRCQEIC